MHHGTTNTIYSVVKMSRYVIGISRRVVWPIAREARRQKGFPDSRMSPSNNSRRPDVQLSPSPRYTSGRSKYFPAESSVISIPTSYLDRGKPNHVCCSVANFTHQFSLRMHQAYSASNGELKPRFDRGSEYMAYRTTYFFTCFVEMRCALIYKNKTICK